MDIRVLGQGDGRRYRELQLHAGGQVSGWIGGIHGRLRRDANCMDLPQTPLSRTWGVEHDGRLLGILGVTRLGAQGGVAHLWLRDVYVRPRYRGTPVSRLLMEAALAWCEDAHADVEHLRGALQLGNARAMRFAERWGFRPLYCVPAVEPGANAHVIMESAWPRGGLY